MKCPLDCAFIAPLLFLASGSFILLSSATTSRKEGYHIFQSYQCPKQFLFILFFRGLASSLYFLCYLWFGAELLIQESFSVHQCLTTDLMPYRCCVLLTAEAVLGTILLTGTFQFLLLLVLNSSDGMSLRFNLSINKYAIIK